ncbi:DUF6020 family protein [Bifidobacterium olomucense]|uniref:Sortase B cell surface sorting signal n=1 Tax=Bifidobacterium olomucense TaxID=2675324 RepID=A0A7Y0EZX7_9BIFI|nr:DUF6020 family protein [Bifidobacterium sp. DSM 109959]NMM98531.1 hypothetical protein [Bifidobacterium sp. DSM 109959]
MWNVVVFAANVAEDTRFELVRRSRQNTRRIVHLAARLADCRSDRYGLTSRHTLSAQSTRHTLATRHTLVAYLAARHPSALSETVKSRFLPYLLALLVCWLPWIALTWPGSMRDDTVAQYLQASGIHRYYTQHPLFDTLTFGLFWRLGETIGGGSPLVGQAVYTAFQSVALASGAALLLCYIRKLGAPRWLIGLSLIYLATSYVVVGSVTTMGKDSLHTVFFLPLAVVFAEICLTRGRILERRPVAAAFVALLFAAVVSKRTALVIVLCAGCGLLAVCRKGKPRFRTFACLAVALLLAQGVWSPLAAAATHANPSPGREVWGLITQPVAQVAHEHPNDPNAITEPQRARLNAVMDLDRAAADINPHRTNETFATLREHPAPTVGQKLAALRTWTELGLSHPAEYVKAYAGPIRAWWDPSLNFAYPTDSDYLFTPGYLKQWSTFLPQGAGEATPSGRAEREAIGKSEAEAKGAQKESKTNEEQAGVPNDGKAAAQSSAAQDSADQDADVAAAERTLSPLMGTSHRPQWQRSVLQSVRQWVRGGNPLTAMALYVTWIPLIVGLTLLTQAVARRTRRNSTGDGYVADDERNVSIPHNANVDRPHAICRSGGTSRTVGDRNRCDRHPANPVAPALAAYGLLFFTVLSLYASPEALFWYPIPMYFTLPLFVALPFVAGRADGSAHVGMPESAASSPNPAAPLSE